MNNDLRDFRNASTSGLALSALVFLALGCAFTFDILFNCGRIFGTGASQTLAERLILVFVGLIMLVSGLSFIVVGTACACHLRLRWKINQKLDELSKLPHGLKVFHTPPKVRATHGGPGGQAFSWLYKTSIASTKGSVVIEEFGPFVWLNEKWGFPKSGRKLLTSDDFARWYSCPGAKLTEGQEFSYDGNWTGRDVLSGGKLLWYFIGVTSNGQRVKGEAIVEILPEVSGD